MKTILADITTLNVDATGIEEYDAHFHRRKSTASVNPKIDGEDDGTIHPIESSSTAPQLICSL